MKRELPKNSRLWPCMKKKEKKKEQQERTPNIWNCVPGAVPSTIPCSNLTSCDGDERRVTLLPSSKAKPRLRGWKVQITGRNRVRVWGRRRVCTPGPPGVPQLHFGFQGSQHDPAVPVVHSREERALGDAVVGREGGSLSCFLVGSGVCLPPAWSTGSIETP